MPHSLADAIFWIAVACCTVAQLAIIRSVVASRTFAEGSSQPTSSATASPRVVEIAWAVLPGIALAVVLVFTWSAIHAPASPASPASPESPASAVAATLAP
ncbi:MAG TPA: hypothetical protein VN706_01990 [Gemmatimonadaceae bacterium]|nr:hypothetical protein [Gemmatimonadaceae bacterium]